MQPVHPTHDSEYTAGYAVYNPHQNATIEQLSGGVADENVLPFDEALEHLESLKEQCDNDGDHLEIVQIRRTHPPMDDLEVIERALSECDVGDLVKLPADHTPKKHAGTWVRLIDFTGTVDYGPRVWVYGHPSTGEQLGTVVVTPDDQRGTLDTRRPETYTNSTQSE
jgi:hypothetical protein